MRALVVGYGLSGKSAKKLLKKMGYKVTVIEDDKSEKYYKNFEKM